MELTIKSFHWTGKAECKLGLIHACVLHVNTYTHTHTHREKPLDDGHITHFRNSASQWPVGLPDAQWSWFGLLNNY